MPDPHGREIRMLIDPPAPEWGSRGPNTATLREDISRWYRPAGGLGLATFMSQVASERNGSQPFDPNGLDEDIPVSLEPMRSRTNGLFYPDDRTIHLNDRYHADTMGRQETLEHERTHALLGHSVRPAIDEKARYSVNKPVPQWASYIKTPSEIDARLATIKRRYAYHTGRLVDTPEEATRALKWYGKNYKDMDTESPDFDPMGKRVAGEYLLLPQDKRDQVLKRMTEVVNAANGGYRGAS